MLVVATDAHFADLISGRAPEGLRLVPENVGSSEVIGMLRNLAASSRPFFDPCAWMIVEADEIVGLLSVVRQPEPGGLHIGYGVAPSRRKLGLATSAVRDLVAWARKDGRLSWISAETGKNNVASQLVLERNGFERTGERVDEEDGPVLGWRVKV